MSNRRLVYLDNNATTRVAPEVVEAIHARGMAVSTLTPATASEAVEGMFGVVDANIDIVRQKAQAE